MDESSDDDVFYCNFNGKKIIINLYEEFKVFKKQCAKDLKIENENDIKFYIKLSNDIKIEITNQEIYEDNILNDPSVKEVFCILDKNSNNKKKEKSITDYEGKLLSIIKKLEEKVNKLECNNNEILQKNIELENQLSTLKNQFEKYKKETDIKLNQLELRTGLETENYIEERKKIASSTNISNRQIPIIENEKKINVIKIHTINPKGLENNYNDIYNSNINNNFQSNFYSFEISLISEKLLKNNIDKNNNYLKATAKLKNNGSSDFPSYCYLKSKSDDNESNFYIKDTIINNGEVVKINEIIEITLYLFFKNKNINNGLFYINFILYNDELGIIGKEEKMEIPLFDNN